MSIVDWPAGPAGLSVLFSSFFSTPWHARRMPCRPRRNGNKSIHPAALSSLCFKVLNWRNQKSPAVQDEPSGGPMLIHPSTRTPDKLSPIAVRVCALVWAPIRGYTSRRKKKTPLATPVSPGWLGADRRAISLSACMCSTSWDGNDNDKRRYRLGIGVWRGLRRQWGQLASTRQTRWGGDAMAGIRRPVFFVRASHSISADVALWLSSSRLSLRVSG